MRKLASIREVYSITPIEGRDKIELAFVDGWQVIVKKDEFKPGDLCVYIEIDSLLPQLPEFEFLAPKKYIIKTMKMGGVRSEGIVFPLTILPASKQRKVFVGQDVTKVLGITQYNVEPEVSVTATTRLLNWFMRFEIVRKMFKNTKRVKNAQIGFPNWITKTDEERIQNCSKFVSAYEGKWRVTEKLDGCSATYGLRLSKGANAEYAVCSRNRRLFDTDNVWHTIGQKYNMQSVLENLVAMFDVKESIVVQGEILGPKIQGNKYKLTEPDFWVFNVKVDGKQHLFDPSMIKSFGLNVVPVKEESIELLGKTVDEILALATFKSTINPTTLAEGLVFRSEDTSTGRHHSFKAVSPEFLISNKE